MVRAVYKTPFNGARIIYWFAVGCFEVPETFDQAEARGLELAAAGESAAAARGRGSSRGKARTTTRTCTVLKQPRNTLIT